jgi:hypothetical protein
MLAAANEASHQPLLGKKLAETYYAASEPEAMTRTWQHVIDEIIKLKEGSTRERWDRAAKDPAFAEIKSMLVTSSGLPGRAQRWFRGYERLHPKDSQLRLAYELAAQVHPPKAPLAQVESRISGLLRSTSTSPALNAN